LLLREGNLKIDGHIPSPSSSPGELGEALAILESKFSAIFPEQIAFHGLTPPTGGIWDKIGALQLVQFNAKGGWFVIGYRVPRPANRIADRRQREAATP
jgi:hypothetical protein